MNYRKPKAQKVFQGTFRPNREVENEPEPTPAGNTRKPPRYFNKYSKAFWNDVQSELIETGVLTVVDWRAFELCCEAYGQFREAHDAIYNPIDHETGKRSKRTLEEYLKGKNSQTMPQYTALNKGREAFFKYANVLGLNPVARGRIDIRKSEAEEDDPMIAILNEASRG